MVAVKVLEVAVRKLLVTLGVIALALPALASAASAKPDAPLGVVMLGNRANVGRAAASSGTSVYDGDTLSTDETGSLRVRFGGAQIILGESTAVDLHQQDGMVDLILRHGVVRFAGVPGSPIELHVLQAMVRTKSDAATGQITLLSSREFQVGSEKGDLDVNINGEDQVVSAPHAYDMTINAMPLLVGGARQTGSQTAGQNGGQNNGQNNGQNGGQQNGNNNNNNNNNNNGGAGGAIGGGTTTTAIIEAVGGGVGTGVLLYLIFESPSIL
jgi:hypothetical protein